jgi:RND family efflux transporter MFP subunit
MDGNMIKKIDEEKKDQIKKKLAPIVIRYIALFLILGLLIAFISYAISHKVVVDYETPAPIVVVQSATIGSIEKKVELPTYIEAKDMIPVIPFVAGTIEEYSVSVGDYVQKDQVLAQIDTTIFEQQKLQAQAAYDAYKSTYDRVKKLYENNSTSEQNYDEVKAKMEASRAQLEQAKTQLGYATVKAPVSGTVLIAPQAKGSIASSPNPMAVIADLSNQIVNIEVPEKYFDIFNANKDTMRVTISRPNNGTSTTAQVLSIDPYIKPESKVFALKCQLQGDLSYFRPGMYVLATIEYDRAENVPVLPQRVRKTDGSVYYYDPSDATANYISPEQLNITMENEDYFEVPAKYASFNFIVDGQNTVFDKQKVDIKGDN